MHGKRDLEKHAQHVGLTQLSRQILPITKDRYDPRHTLQRRVIWRQGQGWRGCTVMTFSRVVRVGVDGGWFGCGWEAGQIKDGEEEVILVRRIVVRS